MERRYLIVNFRWMSQSKIGEIVEMDKNIHLFYENIKNIPWLDFKVVGLENKFYDYYYAQEELYLIHDKISDAIWFIHAKSPKEALYILKTRWF